MITTQLRFVPGPTAAATVEEPRVLRFPGAVRDVLCRPDPRAMSADDLTRSIEHTLDRMQECLDELQGEASRPFRMSDYRSDDDLPAA